MLSFISIPNPNNLTFNPIVTAFPLVGTKKYTILKLRSSHFVFVKLAKKNKSLSCFCKEGSESEGESAVGYNLEGEILEFMKGSERPGDFPTKAELVESGRRDLVDDIIRSRGWLTLGWDLEEKSEENGIMIVENDTFVRGLEGNEEEKNEENGVLREENDMFVRGFEGNEEKRSEETGKMGEENGVMREDDDTTSGFVRGFDKDEDVETFGEDGYWVSTSFGHSPAVSEMSFEMGDKEEDSGVEGILARLKRERNLCLSANLTKQPLSRYSSDGSSFEGSGDVDLSDVDISLKPDVKICTIQQDSFSNAEYEVFNLEELKSEISLTKQNPKQMLPFLQQVNFLLMRSQFREADGAPNDGIIANMEGSSDVLEENWNSSHNDIQTRLQHLKLELTSTFTSLRSKSEKLISEEGYGNFTDMHKLSDALEFQETEIMNAKDSLRAIRAKLAVLEGKMTLAIIGARKKIDEKQKKIDGARRALHLLRDISVVWPNSASEVFLVGSFDGWTTQRRMNRSSSGIFSVELKLYPGKYEIKFIVDGVWKVDPLRPIVKNNGYENNLITVT